MPTMIGACGNVFLILTVLANIVRVASATVVIFGKELLKAPVTELSVPEDDEQVWYDLI